MNSAAREAGVDPKARVFTPFPRLGAMLFARTTHAIGLNDVCDSMRHKGAAGPRGFRGKESGVRGVGIRLPNP